MKPFYFFNFEPYFFSEIKPFIFLLLPGFVSFLKTENPHKNFKVNFVHILYILNNYKTTCCSYEEPTLNILLLWRHALKKAYFYILVKVFSKFDSTLESPSYFSLSSNRDMIYRNKTCTYLLKYWLDLSITAIRLHVYL